MLEQVECPACAGCCGALLAACEGARVPGAGGREGCVGQEELGARREEGREGRELEEVKGVKGGRRREG
eukprot:3297463-Rhodomonas_salina.2